MGIITDINKIAKKIGIPVKQWPGSCYAIACACVDKKVVVGKPRYGHYRGFIHPDSMFASHVKIGWCQHGWVELSDGKIFDPTRWVFECSKPYIYIGENKSELDMDMVLQKQYDIGGSIARAQFRTPPPKFNSEKKTCEFKVSDNLLSLLRAMLDDDQQKLLADIFDRKRTIHTFTVEQLAWLACANPNDFEHKDVEEFYRVLESKDLDAFVPLDNWKLIME